MGKSNSASGRVSGCTCECECKGDCGEHEWESKCTWKSVRTGVSGGAQDMSWKVSRK